jgi:hypothetical protein
MKNDWFLESERAVWKAVFFMGHLFEDFIG